MLIAFSFAYWRQLFPKNWPDIIIPARVIYFMTLTDNRWIEPVTATAGGGIFGILAEVLLGLLLIFSFHAKLPEPAEEAEDKASKFILKPHLGIYATELSLLLVVGLLIYRFAGYPHGYWLPYTAIVVLQVSHTLTLKKIGERILGTLLGCIAGSVLLLLHPGPAVQVLLSGLSIFLFLFYVRQNYALAAIFITIYVL